MAEKKTIGIIAGLDGEAALTLKTELLAAANDDVELITTEDTFTTCDDPVFCVSDRKIFVFNQAELLAEMGADVIAVPDVASAEFIGEIQREIQTPLVAMQCPCAKKFAEAVLARDTKKLPKPFKLGMIGGLGPAATVDLYDKIVKATPAANDQEHLKVVIEQNPQIDDRTACLLAGGNDPTIAMYNCAKRLQKDGCDYVIIPCNTAHAFLPRLLRQLEVPFVDMQQTMLEAIQDKFGAEARIGLLATSGTIQTGIYGQKAEKMGLAMFTPDAQHQERVMAAIYGPKGAKAGYTDGVCYEDLYSAAEYLVNTYDCNVLILGCTELPLIFHEQDDFEVAGKKVAVVDPTATLARKCVELGEAIVRERGVR